MGELSDYIISEDVWIKAKKNCDLLESAPVITDSQSGSTYITLSINSKLFKKLQMKIQKCIDDRDSVLKPIAEKMLGKLNLNESYITLDISELSSIVGPRLGSDIISDSDMLLLL